MKNTIIKFGLISGGIAAILMTIVTLIAKDNKNIDFEYGAYLGYGTIIIAMSVVYFGIKAFRDSENGGTLTFGKGLQIGLGIMLISCVIYSLAWLVMYYNFIPNFMDEYAAYTVEKAKKANIGQEELAKMLESVKEMKEWYKTPFSIFAITLMEPLPVGLLITIISAFILKKK